MAGAFRTVFGAELSEAVPMNGRTDTWIISRLAELNGATCDTAALARFRDAYIPRLSEEIHLSGPGKRMMPGVRPLLDALAARDDVFLALLTGNFEAGARVKLEHFDLWRYFRCGAYGDDVHERNELLPAALARVEAALGTTVDPRDVVVIGDTPLDVGVALAGGTRSLAVATGGHGVEALRQSGADAALEDLSDLAAVLEALGLSRDS